MKEHEGHEGARAHGEWCHGIDSERVEEEGVLGGGDDDGGREEVCEERLPHGALDAKAVFEAGEGDVGG